MLALFTTMGLRCGIHVSERGEWNKISRNGHGMEWHMEALTCKKINMYAEKVSVYFTFKFQVYQNLKTVMIS